MGAPSLLFEVASGLLKLRVLRFRSDEDGNVWVGVFPDREEILIRRFRLLGVALHCVGAAEAEMASAPISSLSTIQMVKDLLEFGGGFASLMRRQVSLAAHVNWIQMKLR